MSTDLLVTQHQARPDTSPYEWVDAREVLSDAPSSDGPR